MGRMIEAFCPDMHVGRITDVDLAALKQKGCEALLLDLDNTLLPWQSSIVPEDCREWLSRAKSMGFRMCIVSNTHNPRRLNKIAADIQAPALARALKPRPVGFNKAAQMLGCANDRCAVIGDQVLTDMLGGNRAGMYTILVRPMHRREFVGTKISRMIEWFILRRLRQLGRLGTKSDLDKSEVQEAK